jgi:hypothetical protein
MFGRLMRRGWSSPLALIVVALAWPTSSAHAHGPAPAALSVLGWDDSEASLVRLNVGLAQRAPDGRFRFLCPALWGDQRAAPAALLADGTTLVAASAGLVLLDPDGSVRPHPDPNARGTSLDLARSGPDVYVLRVTEEQSEVLAVDADAARTIWSGAQVFFSVTADDRRLLLLRATDLSVAWQWLGLDGAAQELGEVAAARPVEYAFARLSRGVGYALVLEQGRPELARLDSMRWVSVAKATSSIAGPLAVDEVDWLAVDGQLTQLVGDVLLPLEGSPYVSCLEQTQGTSYVCTREGLARLSAQGVGEPIFELSQLAPPDLGLVEERQREACDYQWQDLRFDLFALGIEVSLDLEPVEDAGATDPEADGAEAGGSEPDDAGVEPSTRRARGGCSTLPDVEHTPVLTLVVLLLVSSRVTGRARRR